MSESGLQFRGRPNSLKDQKNQMRILQYCGGGGAGSTPPMTTVPGAVFKLRVSKNIVFNRRIVLEGDALYGIWITQDVSSLVDVATYISLADDDSYDIQSTAKKSGIQISGPPPYDVEFDVEDCPQPFLRQDQGGGPNPAWEAAVYVYLWWGSSEYYFSQATAITAAAVLASHPFNIIKHDNDIKI